MSNDDKKTSKQTMSLSDIIAGFLFGFRQLWWIAVVLMVIGGLIGYALYSRSYAPVYASNATFTITTPESEEENEDSYSNNSQLASMLGTSFDYLINNEVFYQIIENDIGISYIPCSIEVSALENTNILEITTKGSDSEMNLKVLNSVIENYDSVTEFVLGDTELTILEKPNAPVDPTNPYNPIEQIIEFMLIFFCVGILPSIFYAIFVRKIKSTDDVKKYLSINCFGELPQVASEEKKGKVENCSILDKNVGFRYLESVRAVSSRIEKEIKKRGCRIILVTSTKDNEGKSTFAMNLAYSLSKTQNKVMLIDANVRDPKLKKMTEVEMKSYSMDMFLKGEVRSSEAIVNIKATRVLLLAPDKVSKNPTECLNSEALAKFIDESRQVVDYTIIDASCCKYVSDAAVLAKYSDGVVYIVRENDARINTILDAVQEFSYTRVPILGCVINGSAGRIGTAYGYGYSGRYGYGRNYGYQRSYGYGSAEYGTVSDKEFRSRARKVSSSISMKTTNEQRENLKRKNLAGTGREDKNQ